MWVTLSTDPNFIKLSTDKVMIGNGSSESDAVNFYALNNTTSVSITPTIPGDTTYVITKPGNVKIVNVAPVIIEPTEDARSVIALDELEINYQISDVDADEDVITDWDWGDMSAHTVTTGRVGVVKHVYNSIGVYSLRVRSRDPDNEHSITRSISVNVTAGVPKPTISVICDTSKLTETPSNILSYVTVRLSEPYTKGDLRYKLVVEQADDSSTTNIVMQHAINETELTIPFGQLEGATQSSFRIMDGTSNTEGMGVRITAIPTDPIAANYYVSVSKLIMFQNTPPVIASPTMYQYTEEYPATVPREYVYNFRDHSADLDGIVSVWDFGDGTPKITVTGASGSINHTYAVAGIYNLTILVKDKDEIASGAYKDAETFVVNIGDPPSITVLPNEMTLMEYSTKSPQIQVELSSKFQYAVPVTLPVTPANSIGAGRLILGVTTIEFKAGEVVKTVGILSDLDGTAASYSGAGFSITPSITPGQPSTAEAQGFFKTFNSATVRIQNEDPIISAPRASASAQDILYELSQGIKKAFAYSIKDCPADSAATGMTVTWNWGDGTPATTTQGASGAAEHTYTSFGVYEIVMTARDKDGGWDERRFYVSVSAAQTLWVTPVGPNANSKYYGLTYTGVPLGSGTVVSADAVSSVFANNIYKFIFEATAGQGSLEAIPDKTAEEGAYDSFFYAWDDFGAGLIATDLLSPMKSDPVCVVPMASSATGGVYQVRAIFSREFRPLDNKGDLNQDGIPDDYQNPVTGTTLKDIVSAVATGDPDENVELYAVTGLAQTNPDGDVNPKLKNYGEINMTDEDCTPFYTITEIRGKDLGLNDPIVGRGPDRDMATDGDLDEPGASIGIETRGSDPTKPDTDNDGLPDGYEYYFWYFASIQNGVGHRYDPANPGGSIIIESKAITEQFNPLTAMAADSDTDNDGLTDLEEFALGTNPIEWDTDGDGMPDGWETLMGTNPIYPNINDSNNNPDGDWMAYATIARQLVTVEVDGVETVYIAQGATEGETSGRFWTSYTYGGEDGPIALGHPVANNEVFGETGQILSIEDNVEVVILHFQVYQEFGFDPRVAWGRSRLSQTDQTRPFTSTDEFLLCKFMANVVNGGGEIRPQDWAHTTTCPLTPDSDAYVANGTLCHYMLPDGWELYVACGPNGTNMQFSPWNVNDGYNWTNPAQSADYDDMFNRFPNYREFAGTEVSAHYNNASLYTGSMHGQEVIGQITIYRPSQDEAWINKFWPTNPWREDTDGDGLPDWKEQGTAAAGFGAVLQYGTPADDGVNTCFRGGGLNPCTMDTDWDGLCDAWEVYFIGTNAVSSITSNPYIEHGMDPTYGPGNDINNPQTIGMGDAYSWQDAWVMGGNRRREMDFDNDGLENYQEYLVQSMRHLRWDIGPELPMDYETYAGLHLVDMLFTAISNPWDIARVPYWAAMVNPFCVVHAPATMLLPLVNDPLGYASCDPRLADTDGDGMDDHYELFHGLNPLLGSLDIVSDVVFMGMATAREGDFNPWVAQALADGEIVEGQPLPMNFVKYPWLAGMAEADPDGDGLRNFEERIEADANMPSAFNTDPSPLWMTDCFSTNSLVARFYDPWLNFYWDMMGRDTQQPFYFASFEMNEGYDSDNDGVSDKNEVLKTTQSMANPQDNDDPRRRQALWFDGEQSAAETLGSYAMSEYSLRSFTVELWFCPEDVTRDQVLLERPVKYTESDLSTTTEVVRVNFRIGIQADGRLYAMYQNAGVHDEESGAVIAYGPILTEGEWMHVAAKMDGNAGSFKLFVNGTVQQNVLTTLIPATGVMPLEDAIVNNERQRGFESTPALIVLGASNLDPEHQIMEGPLWLNHTNFYKGYIDEVRIWDGARKDLEILENYKRRFTREDLLANRQAITNSLNMGGSRIAGSARLLPAELLYSYNFDNLFSADEAESVAKVPRGFNADTVAINRPEGYEVGWWSAWESKSAVYNDYGYVPWIENGVAHLAPDNGVTPASRYWSLTCSGDDPVLDKFVFPYTNDVYGFRYRNDAGDSKNYYNSPKGAFEGNAPTGTTSINKESSWAIETMSDLLPLGNAWAKFAPTMWDDGSAASVWAETGNDVDSDGLPDWWEEIVTKLFDGPYTVNEVTTYVTDPEVYTVITNMVEGSDTEIESIVTNYTPIAVTSMVTNYSEMVSWDDLYPDGSGMTAGERYLRDIANGWTETKNPNTGYDESQLVKQSSDADGDGLPDWWENLYGLSSSSAEGDNGRNGDPDKDGLSNYAEYLIAEVYGFAALSPIQFRSDLNQLESDYFIKVGSTYLGALFSDHDMIEDVWEDLYDMRAVNRFVYDPLADFDEDGWTNWSESRYGAHALRSDPTIKSRTDFEGHLVKEMPVPMIKATFYYKGRSVKSPIIMKAWHEGVDVNGVPDAIWTIPADGAAVTKEVNVGYWDSSKAVKGWFSPGAVMPGTVEFSIVGRGTDGQNYTVPFSSDIPGTPATGGDLYVLEGTTPRVDYPPVGKVDYTTGAYEIDLEAWDGTYYSASTNQLQIIPAESFIRVSYQSALTEAYPKTVYLTDADEPSVEQPSLGFLREGNNTFIAFIDPDDDGDWTPGEPFAVAANFLTDIGWDRNEVIFDLTESVPGQLRYSLTANTSAEAALTGAGDSVGGSGDSAATQTRIRILRTCVNGNTNSYRRIVFDKTLTNGRSYITEADTLSAGQLVFDWGFAGVPSSVLPEYAVYDVYIGDMASLTDTNLVANYTFTNRFDAVQAQAAAIAPRGYVYAARPTFTWTMQEGYPAFALQIRRAGSTSTLYSSGVRRAPARNSEGQFVWTAPIYVGQDLPANAVYEWRVIGLNAKYYSTGTSAVWSGWTRFRMDAAKPLSSAGYGSIKAKVKYYGPVTTLSDRIKVCAYNNAGFAGNPEAQIVLGAAETSAATDTSAKSVNAILNGLATSDKAGPYYVMAYIDQNNNGVRDDWESWGYANYYGQTDKAYDPKAVEVSYSGDIPEVEIFIEDADTDQDWFPDSWEYTKNSASANFLTLTGPNTSSVVDTEINPAFAQGEITGKHLQAMSILFNVDLSGTTPVVAAASEAGLSLTLKSLTFSDSGVPTLTVEASSNGPGVLAAENVKVVLQYTESLENQDWREIPTDTDTIRANGESVLTGKNGILGKRSGFFRIKTVK